jgi:hypothetical protein
MLAFWRRTLHHMVKRLEGTLFLLRLESVHQKVKFFLDGAHFRSLGLITSPRSGVCNSRKHADLFRRKSTLCETTTLFPVCT